MLIVIAAASILAIAVLVRLFNQVAPRQICPICVGVSGTWLWLIAAHLFGYSVDLVVPALLLGGSVVGIAYQLEKRMFAEPAGWRTPFLWKTLFVPGGLIAAYSLLVEWWGIFLALVVFLSGVALAFLSLPKSRGVRPGAVEELEKKMKDCC